MKITTGNQLPLLPLPLKEKNKPSGFSLIEVLVVIAIIGIVATIAIPSFLKWLPNIRLKSAARDLYSNIQEAKMKAIKQNNDWGIVFNVANDTYQIQSDFGGTNKVEKTIDLTKYKSGVSFGNGAATSFVPDDPSAAMPADHVSYPGNDVTLSPLGTTEDGYIYLNNNNAESIAVGTLAGGSIRITRWRGNHWD